MDNDECVSEYGLMTYQQITGHLGDASFHSITCSGTDQINKKTEHKQI